MDIKPQSPHIDLKRFIYFGNEPLPNLPKTLNEVNRLKAMNQYKDNPKLSPEENKKRREYFIKMEEYLRNKKDFTKSIKQRKLEKKKAKIAAKSKRKNRS